MENMEMSNKNGLDLTFEEKEAVEEFRKRMSTDVKKSMLEDTYLFYRFLKVQDFNIDQAEKLLREMLQWRRQLKVDTIVEDYDPPEVLKFAFRNHRIAFDKKGRTVHYSAAGKLDPKGLLRSATLLDIEKTFAQIIEKDEQELVKKRKTPDGPYPGITIIYDLQDLSFALASHKRGLETFIKMAKIYQNYYPERVEQMYIINVSPYFVIAFNLLKNFLSNSFINKGIFFKGTEHKEELLKYVDADDLPAFLGGNRTDPDGNPLCETIVNTGGKIDETYYIDKSNKSLKNSPNVKKLVLSRASFSEIELEVEQPGSVIEWEFEIASRDIGFGLFFKEMVDGEEKIVEIVPLLRLDTELFAETGVYTCEKAGTYIMLFDNSYSWMRAKEIYYTTVIVSPGDVTTKIKN